MIYQVKITLLDIKPPIWRRLLVPADISLHEFHWLLQQAMGWTNSHLYEFEIDGQSYGVPDPDSEDMMSSETIKLSRFVKKEGTKFTYMYDFGDGWEHDILIEKILPPEKGKKYPICTDGKRACPPEDCGGTGGYEDLLKTLANPKHPEHKNMMEWLGGEFNPEEFDIETTNEALREEPVVEDLG